MLESVNADAGTVTTTSTDGSGNTSTTTMPTTIQLTRIGMRLPKAFAEVGDRFRKSLLRIKRTYQL